MVEYTLEGAAWSGSNITWSFADTTYGIDASDPFSGPITGGYQAAIQAALQQWSAVSSLTFTQVSDNPNPAQAADIRIGFGDLGTASTGVIGQTNLRWDGIGSLVPDEVVRLEDPSQFALTTGDEVNFTYAGTTATLEQVALHEIGHALGLGHASDPNAVMYASVGAANQNLDGTDIAGIQSLYGPPVSSPEAPAPTPTPVPAPVVEPDTLVLYLSEDAWLGDAQFIASIDGQQLSDPQSVTVSHAAGQLEAFTFQGQFGAGPHDLAVSFVNDAWGGTSDTDRNLYVGSVIYNGVGAPQDSAALYSNGTVHFQV